MSDDQDLPDDEPPVGYRRPPVSSQFPKGKSGHKFGRPRGRHKTAPYEAVLGQMVTVRENGVERQVTAEEFFLLQLTKRGLEGDGAAARAMAKAIEEVQALPRHQSGTFPFAIVLVPLGSFAQVLELLRMARMLDRYRDSARVGLEPWIVVAALARLGSRRLSLAEQETVLRATRTPGKVKWPDWWAVHNVSAS